MIRQRAQQPAIAAASDGTVLLNVVDLLPPSVQLRLGKVLGASSVFVGVPLNQRDAEEVVERLDGAAAEASARLLGGRSGKPSKNPPRKRRQ
jgi:transcriptional regulator with AAA-type ATPase domain